MTCKQGKSSSASVGQVSIMGILQFLISVGLWVFEDIFIFDTICVCVSHKNLPTSHLDIPQYNFDTHG
jgi:hypothetical protein